MLAAGTQASRSLVASHPSLPPPPPSSSSTHQNSQSSGRHTLIIPCGGDELNGWRALHDCLRRVASYVEADAAAQQLEQQQLEAGASGSGSGSGAGPPPPPGQPPLPVLDVSSGAVVGPGHPPPALSTSPQGTPVLSVHGRRVFFDVGATARGRFMRITEVAHQDR